MTENRNRNRNPTPGAPLRVLQVCKYYYPVTGGIQNVVRSLVTGIDGVDFRVLAARPRGRGGVDAAHGTDVVRAGSLGAVKSTPLAPAFPYHLRRQLRWADLVHYHLPFPVGPVSHLLNAADTPFVVTFHDDIVGKGPAVYPYAPVLDRFLGAAERIVVTSPNMRDECARLAGFEDRTRVVPIGVDVRGDDAPRPDSRPPRKLLFVGRLVEFKGVRHLVSAMKRLDASLSVVGTGPERDALERRAADEGVSGRVTFEGYVSDERLDRLYRDAGAFVLPSVGRNESFGIVQLEAMKRGLPVINTALPTGVPFVSVDGETGITVPPGSPARIADAVETLFENPDLYRRYALNARRRVATEFSRERMLGVTEEIYREAAGCA